jgi:hypothetical protein
MYAATVAGSALSMKSRDEQQPNEYRTKQTYFSLRVNTENVPIRLSSFLSHTTGDNLGCSGFV